MQRAIEDLLHFSESISEIYLQFAHIKNSEDKEELIRPIYVIFHDIVSFTKRCICMFLRLSSSSSSSENSDDDEEESLKNLFEKICDIEDKISLEEREKYSAFIGKRRTIGFKSQQQTLKIS